jgi:inner membrane protein
MFLFGHIGITLGSAVLVTGLITTIRQSSSHRKISQQPKSKSSEYRSISKKAFPITTWIESLGEFMDLRLLIIGSLLPDIIDKPIGMFLFGNGRVFTHSLLVTLLLLITGGYLYLNHKQTGVLAIAIGTFTHLILDQIWLTPQTLFWPSLGWKFPIGVRTNYLPTWISALSRNPEIYISEAIGMVIVLGFIWILIREQKFISFIRNGKLVPAVYKT